MKIIRAATLLLVCLSLCRPGDAQNQSAESNQSPGSDHKQANDLPQARSDSDTAATAPAATEHDAGREKDSNAQRAGVNQNSFDIGVSESMLAWDAWHNRVGKALSKRIQHAAGVMMGTVLIHLTIDKDRKLTAELVKSSGNQRLATACLNGAQSVDGEPVLQFPAESKRQSISFDFQYKRSLFTIPRREYIKDDYERVSSDQAGDPR